MSCPYRVVHPSLSVLLTVALLAAASGRAAANPPEIAAVTIAAPDGLEAARALQVLTLQALQERGLATLDPPELRAPLPLADARGVAGAAGAQRLFVLDLAPLDGAEGSLVAGLAEVDGATGAARARSMLIVATLTDADRAIARLVAAVVDGVPIDDTARLATVTVHEGRPFEKRPTEFLWGFSVASAIGLRGPDAGGAATLWGGALHFLYEIPHAQFGIRLGGGGSEEGGLFDLTVRSAWLIVDGDVSPYVGGGLGISGGSFGGSDGAFGGHALISGGVELFRLHSARLTAGVDLLLPFYRVDGGERWVDDASSELGDRWTPTLMFSVGVLW